MRRLELTFPMPVNLANARLHWRAKTKAHDEWKLRAIVKERGLRGRHRPIERCHVTAVFYSRQPMDDDNCVARLKWPLDLLKERGIIMDDKRPHLMLTGIPEQRQGHPQRIVLTVEEVA